MRKFRQVDFARGRQPRQRVEACQAQQLLDHPRRPVGTGQDLVERVLPIGAVGSELRHLRLDADHRQRCSQLVRGIGGEATFVFEGGAQPEQQAVERDHQRLRFGRHVPPGQRHQVVR
ncbi:MAG: hypothetical protein AW08_03551 [Candidatus Accumulibacter adjunctus]|uniref:Uncharacterized protein n=1 Tax=Candidatus Accumulibacter adjunctus TaxID=1454001 RepID=A0A011NKV3_9PROT|nr:MAG: hypothetical protein AW08_03551 [Candidatus Accumulibacter adjunctus]